MNYEQLLTAAVYILNYTYENIGYEDAYMDGLFISLDTGIVDSAGKMGYSYPGDISAFAQETPVGASCQAQVCIGVDIIPEISKSILVPMTETLKSSLQYSILNYKL